MKKNLQSPATETSSEALLAAPKQREGGSSAPAIQPGPKSQIKNQKWKIPTEFDGLAPAVMDHINDYLRENKYTDTQRMLFTEYGIQISTNKLFRYREKLDLALALEL